MDLAPSPVGTGTHVCAQARPGWRGRLGSGPDELVHAVALHRRVDELSGEPELAVCGAIVAVSAARFPAEADAPCPECVSGVTAAS